VARSRRGDVFDESAVGVCHCIDCRVRKAVLCWYDCASGNICNHRTGWMCERLEFLATISAIDVLGLAISARQSLAAPTQKRVSGGSFFVSQSLGDRRGCDVAFTPGPR